VSLARNPARYLPIRTLVPDNGPRRREVSDVGDNQLSCWTRTARALAERLGFRLARVVAILCNPTPPAERFATSRYVL